MEKLGRNEPCWCGSGKKYKKCHEEFVVYHPFLLSFYRQYHQFPELSFLRESLHEVVCHGIPSDDVVLKDGDIVNVDCSTILNGYFSDSSRMF